MYSKIQEAKKVILSELIKKGYSVEKGKKFWNVSDSKLWYLTKEQADFFIELEKKDKKQKMFADEEKKLLKNYGKKLADYIKEKKLNIVDLGCGDGKKAIELIKVSREKFKIRYFPIDINKYFLEKAYKNVSKIKGIKVVKDKKNLMNFLDISKRNNIKNKEFNTNIFLFLGGNLENSDVHETLHEIRKGMKDNDVLLIGNKLTHPNHKKMIEYYNKSRPIENLLSKPLELLGIKKQDLSYFARFKQDRIEMIFQLKKDYEINNLKFSKGDCFIIAISYKYTKERLNEILTTYFSEVEFFVSENENFVLAICKK